MQEELSNHNWHIYRLSISDYDYTIRLLKDIIKGRKNQLDIKVKKLKKVDYESTDFTVLYV